MALQTVHLRINDAATAQPTPVRLRVTDADGTYYAPFGHAAEFPIGRGEAVGGNVVINGQRWAYIDGTCEIALPPGELTIEAQKGPEFRALRETIRLPVGKMAVRFAIERMTNWRAEGWYSADVRSHCLSPHAALMEAAAEDLALVNVLAEATPILASDGRSYIVFPNLDAFSGQAIALERSEHAVVVGTHNTHPVLGSLALLNAHRVVYPLTFGGGDLTDDWSLGDWCDQCHRKGGLVIWTKAAPAPVGHAAEAFAQAVLGKIDALELLPDRNEPLQVWYQLLSAGCRLPLVGASGKCSNAVPLGAWRTYARVAPTETISPSTWIEAVRAGRTCVSAGPMLQFSADGQLSGGRIERAAGETIHASAAAIGNGSIEAVELIWNGRVMASGATAIDASVEVSTSGWLAARAWLRGRKKLLAHTSPIWIEVPNVPQPRDRGALEALRRHLIAGRDWVERDGRFEQAKSRDHLLQTFEASIGKLAC